MKSYKMIFLEFSGPEDPLHGNVPNKAVRKVAQVMTFLLMKGT